jgi:hypothetical protein
VDTPAGESYKKNYQKATIGTAAPLPSNGKRIVSGQGRPRRSVIAISEKGWCKVTASDYYFGQAHPFKVYVGRPKSVTVRLTKQEAKLLAAAIRKAASKHDEVSLAIYPQKKKPQISVLGKSSLRD